MKEKKQPSRRRKPIRFRSKFEGKVHDALEKRKIPFEYERDKLAYTLNLEYKPDWKMGDRLYLEAKGRFDYTERRKLLAVLLSNPGTEVRMVFMRNQKLGKGSKSTYGDWCDKYGIRWSVFPELPL